jgi:hypothetical protein
MQVVTFTPRSLYLLGKSPRYPLDRRMGGSQGRFQTLCIREKSLTSDGDRTLAVQPVRHRYTDWAISAPWVSLVQFLGVGWDWVHSVLRPLFGLWYQPLTIDDVGCEAVGGMRIGRGNRSTSYSEKTCPSATLPTTNPTWPYPGSNSGRRGGKPATNRLSYGMTWLLGLLRRTPNKIKVKYRIKDR